MPFLHILILAIVQGLTEFLPISSSGHLVLTHYALGHENEAQDLLLDIAVHVGTLFAVLLYFYRDLWQLLHNITAKLRGNAGLSPDSAAPPRLLGFIVVSSIPVVIGGFLFHVFDPSFLRSVEVTAWTTLIFGLLLWFADRCDVDKNSITQMGLKDAVLIGVSQILALVPGTSRSGITMTAARFLGFSRTEAARYSMFLGIVAISGAGCIGGLKLMAAENIVFGIDIVCAVLLSFAAAYISIMLMMKWLARASFKVFALYRIFLASVLFVYIYSPLFA